MEDATGHSGKRRGSKRLMQTPLRALRVVVPPLNLQKEFVQFIQQTNKSKSEILQRLATLNPLKKALMQKHFN